MFKHGHGHGHSHSNSGQMQDQIVQQQVAGNEIRKIDVSAYTITGSMGGNGSINRHSANDDAGSGYVEMISSRFKFIEQNEIPKPHNFEGRIKLYPSGRGSSVPLDLSRLK